MVLEGDGWGRPFFIDGACPFSLVGGAPLEQEGGGLHLAPPSVVVGPRGAVCVGGCLLVPDLVSDEDEMP